jgi:hypothetical protein
VTAKPTIPPAPQPPCIPADRAVLFLEALAKLMSKYPEVGREGTVSP